jgi:hypothetical protein
MKDIHDHILGLIKNTFSSSEDSYIQFSDPSYKPLQFRKENFYTIADKGEIEYKAKNIAFIDGGHAEILKSSSFSLVIIRIYYSVFREGIRINSRKAEFYAFISAKRIESKLYYDIEFIKPLSVQSSIEGINRGTTDLNFLDSILPDKKDLLLDSLDQTIRQGIARAKLSSLADVARRFSELKAASFIVEQLNEQDAIVLDGSLQCTYTNENKYMDELIRKGYDKKVNISGLSKTTSLLTDKGNSISNALRRFEIPGKWAYFPVVEIKNKDHKAEMAFVKLNKSSKRIFRFEISLQQKEELITTASLISNYSKDPIFMGYPYGLIEADKSARISNQEKSILKTLFSAKFGKEWEKVNSMLNEVDAHDILDSIN